MINYFTISEYNISGDPIPEDVADKILLHHILQMNGVRAVHGQAIYVSKNSGYRPKWWETERGRSGNSEHCFEWKGAADYTSEDVKHLLLCLKEHSDYTRICYYPEYNFVHCDHKPSTHRMFESKNGKWTRV